MKMYTLNATVDPRNHHLDASYYFFRFLRVAGPAAKEQRATPKENSSSVEGKIFPRYSRKLRIDGCGPLKSAKYCSITRSSLFSSPVTYHHLSRSSATPGTTTTTRPAAEVAGGRCRPISPPRRAGVPRRGRTTCSSTTPELWRRPQRPLPAQPGRRQAGAVEESAIDLFLTTADSLFEGWHFSLVRQTNIFSLVRVKPTYSALAASTNVTRNCEFSYC